MFVAKIPHKSWLSTILCSNWGTQIAIVFLFVCLRMYCAYVFIPLEWMGLFIYVWFDKPADKNVFHENIVTFHWLECEARRVIDDIFKYILVYTFLREFMAVQCTAPSHVKYIYMCTCSSIVWTFRQIPI